VLRNSALFVLVLSLAFAGAQEKKPEAPTKPPAPAAAAPASDAAPQPTELERTKLENLQLRMMLLNQEEQSIPERRSQIQQAYGAVIREIEAAHPGFAWNPTTNALMPKPAPAAKPAAPAPAEAPKK
jgi:hypothetical protein